METRANHIWVGAITLLLLVGVAALALWIARLNHTDQNEYDIFFGQSVDGVAKGSVVTFSGVPAGQVTQIALSEKNPEYVRVRVALDRKVPILQGTTASLQGSFTGVTTIQLTGAVKGAPPITAPGPGGVPEIPTKRSGLGAILATTPQLLDRIANLTERMTMVLSDKNQKNLSEILANTNRMTGGLAETGPELKTTLLALQTTIAQAQITLASVQQLSETTNASLNDKDSGIAAEAHASLRAAGAAAASIQALVDDTRPGMRQFNERTLPAAEAAIRDLQATTRALREMTDQVRDRGVASIVNGPQLPDYKH